MPASNTREAFADFVGQRVVGVLFGALPVRDRRIAVASKTLVFEDGRGLTFAGNGSFWIDNAKDVQRAIDLKRNELRRTENEIAGVLALAGAHADASAREEPS